MKLRKIIAAVAAAAVAVSAMATTAFAAQDASGLADGTAWLNINKVDWSDYEAEWTNALITGDGTYTVSMHAAEPIALGQFNAIDVVNGDVVFGRTYTITVTEIKINGEKIHYQDGYTQTADGKGITTRVNLYNEWNSPSDEASEDGYYDSRCASGDVMSKSAQMIDPNDSSDVTDLEVTFTVAGIAAAAPAASDDAAASDGATTSSGTGNTAAAVMVTVMAVAGAAALASRKRK